MKNRFNTYDIVCCIAELQKLVGMRVNNIYDIDNKTYLIRFQRSEEKAILLLESGNRIHATAFEWPKNVAPGGFSMKMRKHLKNKRLEKIAQIGTDRIVNMQFGSGEVAYHVIVEMYDRGNIMLTDHEMTILYVLRPHTEGDRFKFAVREKYPENRARESEVLTEEAVLALIQKSKPGDPLKKILLSNTEYGPPLIEHVLIKRGFTNATKIGKTFKMEDLGRVLEAILEAESIFQAAKTVRSKGYIIQKREERPSTGGGEVKEYFMSNQEFHPMLFEQHKALPHKEFETFNQAVDEFFSTLESQKLELKALQQEREAMKKLDNVKKDHDHRLVQLQKTQEVDKQKAELICRNQVLVDQAILAIQTALANQLSWDSIAELVEQSRKHGDPIAQHIKQLKLYMNHISLHLTDPYACDKTDDEDADSDNKEKHENDDVIPPMTVDIDLDLTAFANATRYYDQKRSAAKKQQKTIESQSKAFKSAERKTKQTLKEVQTITNINKARKVYWFEKFFWFISSENYLVIAGRDQQQNELIAKRYMKPTDVYVHADIHGASSVVIKNPTGQPVPPKTLNEAGTMAICYSVAWDAKVVTEAYWVWGEQVSKTAPTGEYLTTGSFVIRGKKNFLPPSHLILGLSFLFRVEDGCVEKHKGERKVLTADSDVVDALEDDPNKEDVEVEILDESDENEHVEEMDNKKNDNLDTIDERESDESKKDNSDLKRDSSDSESEESRFPDTQIKITHSADTKIEIIKESGLSLDKRDVDPDGVIYLGDDKPVMVKPLLGSRGSSESKTKNKKQPSDTSSKDSKESNSNRQQQMKRGQKSKLKKIKEKYGDQDEEERKLRMDILQSSGSSKEKKGKKGKGDSKTVNNKKNEPRVPRPQAPKNDGGEEGGDEDEPTVQPDVDMLDCLTGIPFSEDELLFAVPVVAPYNTLANYKFKAKLTPGTAKRGKAAKTAVAMFLKDKLITQREKDLLKAVKDEQMARNIPGKVKLSAPKLQALKK